jgi:hypothetical protein
MAGRDEYAVVEYGLEAATRLDIEPNIPAALLATRPQRAYG